MLPVNVLIIRYCFVLNVFFRFLFAFEFRYSVEEEKSKRFLRDICFRISYFCASRTDGSCSLAARCGAVRDQI
jgi:hypothetical protein